MSFETILTQQRIDSRRAITYAELRTEVFTELPATASGKIQKFRLREIVREGA